MPRLLLAPILAFALAAQQPGEVRVSAHTYTPPPISITSETRLVQLDVVVRDSRGRAVAGLEKENFEISDEGKPRTITGFSIESRTADAKPAGAQPAAGTPRASSGAAWEAPRSVMLFFDDIHANTGQLRRAQNSAIFFVKHRLGTNARAAVSAASEGLTLDFTADPSKLTAAIDRLRSHVRISENGLAPCPRITPYQAYLIFNAIDPSAMVAAVSEAHACDSADSSISNVYANQPARAGTLSRLPTDQLSISVQQQATQTWEMVRAASMQTYDALAAAIARLSATPGTRVLLLVSEGFLYGLGEEARQQDIIDAAIRSGVTINGLDAKGLWSEPPVRPFNEANETMTLPIQTFLFEASTIGARNSALNSTISEMATATGGLFFHNSNDLNGGFELLGAAPETTYLIAFHPDPQDAVGKYHKLKVRLINARGDYVETRPGYFSPAADPAVDPHRLDRAILATDTVSDFPIQLAGNPGKTDKGITSLSLVIHVDLTKVPFTETEGRYRQKLIFIAALLNAEGEIVTAKEGAMEMALTETTLTRLTASGVNAALTLGAPPGPYRVRVAVQDSTGRLSALNRNVDLK